MTSRTGKRIWEDPELETTLHNKLSSHLRSPEVAMKLIQEIGLSAEQWKSSFSIDPSSVTPRNEKMPESLHKRMCQQAQDNFQATVRENLNFIIDAGRIKIDIRSQAMITGYNDWCVGFVDAQYRVKLRYCEKIIGTPALITSNSGTYSLMQLQGTLTVENISWPELPAFGDGYKVINIVVKNHLKAPDQVLREIQTLRRYAGTVQFVLYTADNANHDLFHSEGIKVIMPESIGIKLKVNNE